MEKTGGAQALAVLASYPRSLKPLFFIFRIFTDGRGCFEEEGRRSKLR